MREALSNLTVGEVVAWTAGLVAFGGLLYKVWGPIKVFQTFLRDWSGKSERKDRAGNVVEDAVPGVLGRIESLRTDMDRVLKQVENSHTTNFRDDLVVLC